VSRERKLITPPARIHLEYHLDGLLEAADEIRELSRKLRTAFDERDIATAADALTGLEVQLFFEVDYHLRQLRRPARRLSKRAYDMLDPVSGDE
jgi:hypothetical protein